MEKLKVWRDNEYESKGTDMRMLCATLSISQEFHVESEEIQESCHLG
jgi:hypothetical protein